MNWRERSARKSPTRPSTVIDVEEDVSDGDGTARRLTAASVSRSREGTRDRLRRKLRGDLDHIVLMAMRKEPHRRYASAEQFSDDIKRYREKSADQGPQGYVGLSLFEVHQAERRRPCRHRALRHRARYRRRDDHRRVAPGGTRIGAG